MNKLQKKSKKLWSRLFGFSRGDNVILKDESVWRKPRYGIIVYVEKDKNLLWNGKPTYLVHYGSQRQREESDYKYAGIFFEEEMKLDTEGFARTFQEWEEEQRKQAKKK